MNVYKGLVDGAEDVLHDIRRHDAERQRVGHSRSDRGTAAVMHRVGLSDAEIVERLGYNPLELAATEPSDLAPAPGR